MKFKVKLKSKDEHLFEIELNALDKLEAETLALQFLESKGWSQFQYKVLFSEEIQDFTEI